MLTSKRKAIAIVGVGAILPDAPSAHEFWNNILNKKYSISEVPPGRWNPDDYYDPDPRALDKTYSKIGGWIRDFDFDWRKFRMPPKVADSLDEGQKWAVTIAANALEDYGYPERPLNTENTAVIIGTAMGGELHYVTNLRISFPEYAHILESVNDFNQLPEDVRTSILSQWRERVDEKYPPISEDTMPGELANIVSGRVANVLNLRGPNYITDAACASSFAAVNDAVKLLNDHHVDAAIAGGVDHMMNVSSFVKFCKIGALSATGSRPFGDGADGFVMGEGSAVFLLKRLEDAERNGDKIYAVIRGVGGSSDGKGKGITAPNPIGQQLALQRAWENAGIDPATATLVEAHGTSTRVGDVVEFESLCKAFGQAQQGSIGLGSAKSNIGHLKAGAGAAGMLKAAMALHYKTLPPTLNAEKINPNIDLENSPFFLVREAQEWPRSNGTPRRCGVSAYGFGGTNFHIVLEEYVPGALVGEDEAAQAVQTQPLPVRSTNAMANKHRPAPVRGILALSAATPTELKDKLDALISRVEGGWAPSKALLPRRVDIEANERLVIDFGDHPDLLDRLQKARKIMGFDNPQAWKAVEAQGIFRGSGKPKGKIAFLFPGQGSQYVNMGRELKEISPVVAEVMEEADAVMEPILGDLLSEKIFVDPDDSTAVMQAQFGLMQTEITQPAMLTMDIAILKLLAEYGFKPHMVMGHSLGEYAGLIAAGIMPFADALEASAARGGEMSRIELDDNGKMAAVLAPYDVVMETLESIDGYVVPANINSSSQSVIGGSSSAVEEAAALFEEKGYRAIMIPVSHAFHTQIVAPASAPLREVLDRLHISEPQMPLVANLTGEFYPQTPDGIKDILQQQVASPVQWVKGLETLYDAGVRMFVEVGPKRALRGFARDVFADKDDVQALMTMHPKTGELPSFNQALCGLYAAGYWGSNGAAVSDIQQDQSVSEPAVETKENGSDGRSNGEIPSMEVLSQVVTQAVQQAIGQGIQPSQQPDKPFDRNLPPQGSVVISGTGLGLPGAEKPVMDPDNAMRILQGEQFVDLIPERFRRMMVDKRVTRLVKGADGNGSFITITDPDEVIKLAGRPGPFDLSEEYGVPQKLVEALDMTTQLAMAAGLDSLREAGIPLVQTYRRTTTGKYLPDRWMLPEAMRDDTGVIFASAFPGGDRFADELKRYYEWENRLAQLEAMQDLKRYSTESSTLNEINRRIGELKGQMEANPYVFDRRFLFRILSMGHSQFAQYIGARGPNTHVNAACASTAQGIAIAEDWIRCGRCRRVVVIGGDIVTGNNLMEWVGAGFLATGAVTTSDRVDEAALPFDRRRHGTIMGMGACSLVVESEDAIRERGMRGVVELLSSETANSAFHGTRLDLDHISMVMNNLVTAAERRFGLNRQAIASNTVFMSHETYTPARGGSASAEVAALRHTFGESASDIIIANTKGFTGHPMGVGVEDVIAVKILEHGIVPPVPNFKEVDPDLGLLNLSRGGRYPVKYAIHLAAGFGSQISMTLTRRIPGSLDRFDNKALYDRWLAGVSGYNQAETEVVKRVLRVKAQGAPANAVAPSGWQYGTGPTTRALEADGVGTIPQPARMTTPAMKPAPQPVQLPTPAKKAAAPPPTVLPQPAIKGAPEPPAAPVAVEESTEIIDSVAVRVVALVADQTGYPADMLDLDLDLEADLGIDTVKQAETFGAIQKEFDIPTSADLSLRDYNTLEKVIGFVKEMRPDLAASQPQKMAPTAAPSAVPVVETAPPPASSSPTDEVDSVTMQVIALVAEQTGYPADMLDLDLDLEADLGIDTVKQAETFLAIREKFNIPQKDDLNLRDYETLEKVIGFVREMRPDLVQAAPAAPLPAPILAAAPVTPPAPAEPQAEPVEDEVGAKVLALVAEQTGYPQDMLQLDLDLEADLGIDTVKQAETFLAIRETFDIPQQEDLNLRDYDTLEKVIGFVHTMRPDLAAASEPEAVPAAPPTTPAENGEDLVASKVLALVSEQTGYPQDMLELDLDLEADLGIDTVKQAETFLAIRETFDIPQQEDLNLRDYDTLEKVIGFVHTMRPDLAGSAKEVTASETVEPILDAELLPAQSAYNLEDADKMPRRVPVPSLRPPLDLCKDSGVTLGENNRVIMMPDQSGLSSALAKRLEKLGVQVLTLDPDQDAGGLLEQIAAWKKEGDLTGIYWLPAFDVEPILDDMDLAAWRMHNDQRVKKYYSVMRDLYEDIDKPGTFLIAATRLGGLFGYGSEGASAPLGGAVSGFTKAYAIEQRMRTDSNGPLVKVIDFETGRKTAAPADRMIAETLQDPGIVEIGYHQDRRYTITLEEQPAVDGGSGLQLNEETVFVVSGAAGGITSEIVSDLAAASQGIFYLLDLVQAPDAGDPVIQLFRQDKDALKRQLIEEARAAGKRPTPVEIDKQMMAIERDEAALRTIESVERAGGKAHYHAVDLLDSQGISAVIEEVADTYGRIDVLIHAGGLLVDRTLPNKEPQQFNLVFDVKADGFFNLLHASKNLSLGATICFSSVAGRFGNNGQSDYSAANDLLCKITSHMRHSRPETKAIAIDWTAWGDIGMAARGSVPTIMKALGIDMLPPESGVPTVRRELVAGGFSGEILVGGALGIMTSELDESGGLDLEKANQWLEEQHGDRLMIGQLTAANLYGGLQVETSLDPKEQPFLFDHAPDEDTPWLPGVMATESLAQLASLLAPDYRVAAVENEQMMGAFKFFRMEPRTLYLRAEAKPEANGDLIVHAALRSITKPAREGLPTREQDHFLAEVRLTKDEPQAITETFEAPQVHSLTTRAEEIYQTFFHGPAYQVLQRVRVYGNKALALIADDLPPNTEPADARSFIAPRLVEACFQTAAQWSIEAKNAMAFPLGFDALIPLRQAQEAGGKRLYVLLETADDGQTFDAQVVDEDGNVYVILMGYRTVSRPGVES